MEQEIFLKNIMGSGNIALPTFIIGGHYAKLAIFGKHYWRRKMEWISVGDRLPEGNSVWIVTEGKFVQEEAAYYMADNEWAFTLDGEEIKDVTHWMPLPEPPSVTGDTGE